MKERSYLRDEATKTQKVLVKHRAKLSKLVRKVSIHDDDMPRSVSVLYSKGVMGKKKYRSVHNLFQ